MNVKNHLIEIQCSLRDTSDVAQAIVQSLIFFRTYGKFNYKHEDNYSIGTLGYELQSCDRINFNYIRCSSPTLVNRINSKIQEFVDKLNDHTHSAILALEFYTKRPSRWPFNDSKIVWELWNLKLNLSNNQQNSAPGGAEPLDEVLGHKLLDIIRIINNDSSLLPQMPTQSDLDTLFDTTFYDLQPYLYNLSYKISENQAGTSSSGLVTNSSNQSTLKKFLLGTLEL